MFYNKNVGIDIDDRNQEDQTPLHLASLGGHYEYASNIISYVAVISNSPITIK